MAFGGKAWPIKAEDINLGPVSSGSPTCAGGILDIGASGGPGVFCDPADTGGNGGFNR